MWSPFFQNPYLQQGPTRKMSWFPTSDRSSDMIWFTASASTRHNSCKVRVCFPRVKQVLEKKSRKLDFFQLEVFSWTCWKSSVHTISFPFIDCPLSVLSFPLLSSDLLTYSLTSLLAYKLYLFSLSLSSLFSASAVFRSKPRQREHWKYIGTIGTLQKFKLLKKNKRFSKRPCQSVKRERSNVKVQRKQW